MDLSNIQDISQLDDLLRKGVLSDEDYIVKAGELMKRPADVVKIERAKKLYEGRETIDTTNSITEEQSRRAEAGILARHKASEQLKTVPQAAIQDYANNMENVVTESDVAKAQGFTGAELERRTGGLAYAEDLDERGIPISARNAFVERNAKGRPPLSTPMASDQDTKAKSIALSMMSKTGQIIPHTEVDPDTNKSGLSLGERAKLGLTTDEEGYQTQLKRILPGSSATSIDTRVNRRFTSNKEFEAYKNDVNARYEKTINLFTQLEKMKAEGRFGSDDESERQYQDVRLQIMRGANQGGVLKPGDERRFIRKPGGKFTAADEDDIRWPDAVDGTGRAMIVAGQVGMSLLAKKNLMSQLKGTALGSALGDTTRQLAIDPTSLPSPGPIIKETALSIPATLAAGAITKGYNTLRGARPNVSPQGKIDLEELRPLYDEIKEEGGRALYPPVAATGLPKVLANRATTFSPVLQGIQDSNKKIGRTLLERTPQYTDDEAAAVSRHFAEKTPIQYADELNNRFPFKAESSVDLASANKTWMRESQKEVAGKYKVVDDAAARENPLFDMRKVSDEATAIEKEVPGYITQRKTTSDSGLVDAQGKPIVSPLNTYSQGKEGIQPDGVLLKIINDVKNIHPTQNTWQAIKESRTQIDNYLENAEGKNYALAYKLRNSLTDALKNPTNRADDFKAAFKDANATSLERFKTMELGKQNFPGQQKPDQGALFSSYANIEKFNPEYFKAIRKYKPAEVKAFSQSVINHRITETNDPVNLVNEWAKNSPDRLKTMLGYDKSVPIEKVIADSNIMDTAQKLQSIKQSPLGSYLDKADSSLSALESRLFSSKTDKFNIKIADEILANHPTPLAKDSSELATMLAVRRIRSMAINEKTGDLNSNAFYSALSALKKNGVWDAISPEVQKRLTGIKAWQNVSSFGKDVGGTMHVSEATGKLLGPSEAVTEPTKTVGRWWHKLSDVYIAKKFTSKRMGDRLVTGHEKAGHKPINILNQLVSVPLETEPGINKGRIRSLLELIGDNDE